MVINNGSVDIVLEDSFLSVMEKDPDPEVSNTGLIMPIRMISKINRIGRTNVVIYPVSGDPASIQFVDEAATCLFLNTMCSLFTINYSR